MKVRVLLKPSFRAVYLINGAFTDGEAITLSGDRVTYITVLPLCAALLPYTVKLCGLRADCNGSLVRVIRLSECEAAIRFAPRYGYVYDCAPSPPKEREDDCVVRFFSQVKRGEYADARKNLAPDLSATVTDEALGSFLAEYDDVFCGDDGYYLVKSDGEATPFEFSLSGGLIGDVAEKTRR